MLLKNEVQAVPTVHTIRGPLDTAELGPTLMHEHLVLKSPGIAKNWPERYDHEAAIQRATEKLQQLAELGIRSLVDNPRRIFEQQGSY